MQDEKDPGASGHAANAARESGGTTGCVLAIGAHAGDMEISVGPALARAAAEGMSLHLLHLTPGEKGHPTLSPEAFAPEKRAQAEETAAILGGRCVFLDYRDGELPDDEAARFRVAAVIRRIRPTAIVTHPERSLHRDHARTHRIVEDAVFLAATRGFDIEGLRAHPVRRILFAENWEDREGFEPFHYVPVQEWIPVWERAVRSYEQFRPEVSRFPYIDYYRSLYRVRGAEAWCGWACAFGVPPGARRTVGALA